MTTRRMTRRGFLQCAGMAPAMAMRAPNLALGLARSDDRAKLAHRTRRIIFNDDGDDVWNTNAATPDGFINVRLVHMRDTQADTLFYCTTQSFSFFTHHTKVGDVFLRQEGPFAHNNMQALLDLGTDPLKLAVEFAHKNGVEAVWTLRMNDIHDAFTPALWGPWKDEHPDALLGKREDWDASPAGGQRRWWSGVNFYRDDVRQRTVALIEEVARNYDVDGIDLDWLRHPIHFPETREGTPVEQRGMKLITGLVRDVRQMLERVGDERGRPILLWTRVPLTIEHGLYMGTDIETWLKEGLVDLVTIGGGYVPFSMPVDEVAKLAQSHGVPAYPCVSNSGMLRRQPFGPGTPYAIEGWRAAAANAFRNGASGISLFNLFPEPGKEDHNRFVRQVFNEVGEPATLAGKDKLFCLDNAAHLDGCGYINHVVPYQQCLPKPLAADRTTAVSVPIGDDPAQTRSAELRVQIEGEAQIAVSINGSQTPLAPSLALNECFGMRWFTGPVALDGLNQGANQLEARHSQTPGDPARLVAAEILIRYA